MKDTPYQYRAEAYREGALWFTCPGSTSIQPWEDATPNDFQIGFHATPTDDQRIEMPIATDLIARTEPTPFRDRAPNMSVGLPAVKLTSENVRTIAAHIIRTIGGVVEVCDNGISIGSTYDNRFLRLGSWVVEDYDYDDEVIVYRIASPDERKKYDLR
ncbi:hypothetical protein FHT44_004969 [Mycolicibacterium sp. BK634]|uniref:hypothetical protein n=1 Tax=Mycolicibacterium sp. BK634 TaxID=2587099 RepID=UPI001620818A|nr:hypothetical protein [Mycolicibacterium sp. BK634]MBB3752457.1 hypothetical protein [Mycolicibacterium sp. BK634]